MIFRCPNEALTGGNFASIEAVSQFGLSPSIIDFKNIVSSSFAISSVRRHCRWEALKQVASEAGIDATLMGEQAFHGA